ncbi:MAG TPA: AraD1 family protein [Flavitalea sp.]|nr:AraD1 family protein [Flavitalea sp.]
MHIIQFLNKHNHRAIGVVEEDKVNVLRNFRSTYELFFSADSNLNPEEVVSMHLSGTYEDYDSIVLSNRLLVPLSHPDNYRTWITGTGLTHYGSADSRDKMHQKISTSRRDELTDSVKMFEMGMRNGKLINNVPGVQPEWFYKGNGFTIVNPGHPVQAPAFGLDMGEEPEIAGIYINDINGTPRRIGFVLGNEFSDHKMEKINYLYLAHSKLRHCSFGPELFLGTLPDSISGLTRIIRNGKTLWEKEFLTGENHMTHNIANLEYHHFKYELFRQPGDVHVHFFGTSVLSFTDEIEPRDGDIFEIESNCFGKSLRNTLNIKKSVADG